MKKHCLDAAPIVIPPFLYFVVTRSPFYLFVIVLAGLIMAGNKALPWLYPGRGVNSKVPFLHIVSVLFWFGIYLFSCMKYTPELYLLHLAFPFLYIAMWIAYYKTIKMDPGRLRDKPNSLKVNVLTFQIDRLIPFRSHLMFDSTSLKR